MARALLVGCGCRGRELGARLLDAGWQVRGTTRREARLAAIEAAGIEPVLADPGRVVTVLDHIEGVSAIGWLLGSARAEPEAIESIHGARLARLCEEVVDTPVRGLVYEVTGSVDAGHLREGARTLSRASQRWRIQYELVEQDPREWRGWVNSAAAAFDRLTVG